LAAPVEIAGTAANALGFARDFGSRLGRRESASTSMPYLLRRSEADVSLRMTELEKLDRPTPLAFCEKWRGEIRTD
jgi:hypothetical protein